MRSSGPQDQQVGALDAETGGDAAALVVIDEILVQLGGALLSINAPLMLHYGGLDERVNAGWPAYEEALKPTVYTVYIYEGANHGFHNDTTPRYDEEDAQLAWQRTIDFFHEHLC